MIFFAFAGKLWLALPYSMFTLADLPMMDSFELDAEKQLVYIKVKDNFVQSSKADLGLESIDWPESEFDEVLD